MQYSVNFAVAALATAASAQLLSVSTDQDHIDLDRYTQPNLNIPGYKREDLGNKAINAPTDEDCYTYIGHSLYADAKRFDPARCVKDCEETTRFNAENLNGRAVCRFVNTYILVRNGKYEAQVCSMYTRSWGRDFATNTGYTADGKTFTITSSYSYSNEKDPGDDKSCLPPLPQPDPEDDPKDPKPDPHDPKDPKPDPHDPKPQDPKPQDPKPQYPKPQYPTPNPNDRVECFKARAWSKFNRHINGRFLEARDRLPASWRINDRQASTFYIDTKGLWRNAHTGSLAFQDSNKRSPWGYVDFDFFGGKKREGDPPLEQCKVVEGKGKGYKYGELVCGKPKGEFYSKGGLLAQGKGLPKHADPVHVEVIKAECPRDKYRWN